MATVSFTNLDQPFSNRMTGDVEFSSYGGTTYSFITTGGSKWRFNGVGLTDNGATPTGGTVTSLALDLDNDNAAAPELIITGLSVAATSFGIGAGTADQQTDNFWLAVLGGADTINFTDADVEFAGDGANIDDGAAHVGGDDLFNDGGAVLVGSSIYGDYMHVFSGSVTGGDDTFTVGAYTISGDFLQLRSGVTAATGGNDVIAPARLANGAGLLHGDAVVTDILLIGGADLIDLRATDVTDYTETPLLIGDVYWINPGASLAGGDDTIHGSARSDLVYGDYQVLVGTAAGGQDSLAGYSGADSIYGNEGNDTVDGGVDNDSLDGGAGNDTVIGSLGRDFLLGGDGDDVLNGGAKKDTMNGGAGGDTLAGGGKGDLIGGGDDADTMFGVTGNDILDGGLGDDILRGAGGRDNIDGGDGADAVEAGPGDDSVSGGSGADTLAGGSGADTLLGFDDDDSIIGAIGDDSIVGGNGDDTFVFVIGGGIDTIVDFAAGAGGPDLIRLLGFGVAFDDFSDVIAAATDDGTNTTIDFGGGNMLILRGVVVADLDVDDFVFT